jgi:hypothetical protein
MAVRGDRSVVTIAQSPADRDCGRIMLRVQSDHGGRRTVADGVPRWDWRCAVFPRATATIARCHRLSAASGVSVSGLSHATFARRRSTLRTCAGACDSRAVGGGGRASPAPGDLPWPPASTEPMIDA